MLLDPELVFPGDSELAALMRAKPWADTPLGPVETWPAGLRAAVRIVLTSRFSMWLGWGDDLTFFYNDAYRRDTLDAKHPRSLGIPAREVWSEIWTEISPRIARVLDTGTATWDEGLMLFLERSGYREETYHTFSYSPLHDDGGRVRGILCVVAEETGRVLSERRVGLLGRLAAETTGAKREAELFAGVERALRADARDLPFTLTYLFDGDTARLAGSTPAGVGAAPVLAIDDAPWPLRALLETARPMEVALDGVWPSGPWAIPPVQAFAVPIAHQGQARPAGVFIAGVNPHRRFDAGYRELMTLVVGQLAAGLATAHAYEEERRRAESLAELDRAKTAFFSNVSHELRTPLTLMLGPLEELLDDPRLGPDAQVELATVHRNGLRLKKLVDTMLDFSRIEAGRTTARFEPTDLAQLTSDLASVFRAATDKAGLTLAVDTPPLDIAVPVDRDMWEKIVLNLVSNAFKFTLAGEIAVGLARRGERVELTVRDTGVGIAADELPRVFERFHRIEGAQGRTHEGTGIGLALVQELVKLHGGTIAVASEPGVGTTFTVAIPIGAGPAAVDPAAPGRGRVAYVEEALRWLPDGEPVAVAPTARARLLVADDNADMRDYLRRLLGARWDVTTVANGRAALDHIRAARPDLVVSDVMMPELDGFGLLAAVRGDPALRDLPVIILSARAGEEARVEGLQAGATDYLAKPFAARELVARIEAQLMAVAVRAADERWARRLATIFERAPVAIAMLRGPDHVIESANAPFRALTGGRAVVGARLGDALPELAPQGLIAIIDGVYRTGVAFVGQSVPTRWQAATETYFDLVFQPLFDELGEVTGVVGIGHDVTALATARHDAEAANRTKDEFLAMLGHELRNPLAPITTALELMRLRGDVGAPRERAVIERQVRHLVTLVDDLLDISRITRGKVELRPEPTEIADAVARAVEVASPLLEDRRHVLTVDVPRGLVVSGDPARLAQVLSNLLTNAAKYTAKGGHIWVHAAADHGDVVIRVVDNGIGIEPAMLRRVFEPFAQEHQSIERAQGGLGLGLAIVDNLVKLHGGTVAAASAGRGHGSELTVRLPRIQAAAPAAAVAGPAVAPAGGARILVIDDNVDAALLLADVLAAGGYQTVAAHDGPSALQAAEAFAPELAVIDLGLPVMDGYELARLLSERDDRVRLVALTGYGQPQDRARTAAAGFEAHLVKPVEIDRLRGVIAKLLRRDPE
jgi:signal transduction histidine kinase